MPASSGKPSWPRAGRPRKPKAQPRGASWLEARQKVFDRDGTICYLCGHDGAGEIDHVIPAPRDDPDAYLDLSNLRPAHGWKSPCPLGCGACNQRKGRAAPKAKLDIVAEPPKTGEPICCQPCHDYWERTGGRYPSRCWSGSFRPATESMPAQITKTRTKCERKT